MSVNNKFSSNPGNKSNVILYNSCGMFKILLLLLLSCVGLYAQGGTGGQPGNPIQYTTTTPSGACGRNNIRLLTPNGVLYTCVNGTWMAATTPGGGALPAGSTNADIQCWSSATTFEVCVNTTISGRATGGAATLTADVVNPFIQAKNTQSATAPGAAKCDVRVIAGTNAGTGKIVINCGTSATEVTIADNIGGSF